MSIQSGLLGAAVTLMGAVSLSTPQVMQIHEVRGHRVSAEGQSLRLNNELFHSANSDSGLIRGGNDTESMKRPDPAMASEHQFS